MWGLGYALDSGAYEAYVYDELAGQGKAKSFNKVYTRSLSMAYLGMAVAYVGASLIGATQYVTLLVVSIVSCLVSAFLAGLFPKEKKRLPHPEDMIRPKYLSQAWKEVRQSRVIGGLVVTVAAIIGIYETMAEYVPVYYKGAGALQ